MSLILEALKKSEAERQLGRAPGLGTPMLHGSKRSRAPMWIGVAVLCLAAGFGGAYALLRLAAPVAAPEPAAPAAAASVPAVAAPDAADAGTQQTPSTSRPPVTASPAREHESGSGSEARPAAAQPVARPLPPSELKPQLPRDPIFESIEREAMAMVAPSAPPAREPARDGPVSQSPAETELPAVPSVDHLDPALRNSLPPLRLSMLVYSDRPDGRFVRIDGQRLAEGDRLSPTLKLVEIRRGGVVFDADGRTFFLPRP